MKISPALIVILLLAFFSCDDLEEKRQSESAYQYKNLTLSIDKPSRGDTIKISASLPDTLKPGNLDWRMYSMDLKRWQAEDLEVKLQDSLWKATAVVPDSSVAMFFYFGHLSEENAIPQKIFDNNGNQLAASTMSLILFRESYSQFLEIGMTDRYPLKMDKALTQLKADPSAQLNLDQSLFYSASNNQDSLLLYYMNNRYQDYQKMTDPGEKELENLLTIVSIRKNDEQKDSLRMLIAERFPAGKESQKMMLNEFRQTDSPVVKDSLYNHLRENGVTEGYQHDSMAWELAVAAYEDDNYDLFWEYIEQIDDPLRAASWLNDSAWNLAEKGKKLEFAEKAIDQSLKLLDLDVYRKQNPILTGKQAKEQFGYQKRMYLDTHALVKFKNGELAEAIQAQKKAVGKGFNPQYNERYMKYLMADNAFAKAKEFGTKAYRNNALSKQGKSYLKTAVEKTGGDFAVIEKRLEELSTEKLKTELAAEIVNKKAPAFSAKNLDGKTITLEDYKGKIVVLDFWATWCMPCIASFPGMQMAMQDFENDEEVAFLFIDTFEEVSAEKVNQFLVDKAYDFPTILDRGDKVGTPIATEYDVSGIPHKVIIDGNGMIRFENTGYSGDPDKTRQKIKLQIEMLKSQNSA